MIWLFKIDLRSAKINAVYQQGYSLISMMIGLLVTSISMLAMMALYKSAVFHIYNPDSGSQISAIRNQQNLSGLLTMQSLLQGAGFGIADAASNTHFILVDGATLSTTTGNSLLTSPGSMVTISYSTKTGNAIFWEENNGLSNVTTDYICRGLLSDKDNFALYALSSTSSCDTVVSSWANQTWNISRIIKPDVLNGAIVFIAKLNSGKCSPYGSEMDASVLASNVSTLAGIESSAANKAGLQVSINWSPSASYTPWISCLLNFSS